MKRAILVLFVLVMGVGACTPTPRHTNAAALQDNRNNDNQARLATNQASPQLGFSNERANLIERYTRFNNPNKIGYIYMFSSTGQIIDYSDVKGKVSNLSSNLDPTNKIACKKISDSHGLECGVIDESEPDGSYGTNGHGIFWFDSRGVYHEYVGDYQYTDQPRTITQQPILVVSAAVNAAGK